MGDLTLAQYQSRVLLLLNNTRTTHPAVVAGLHTQAINDAANDLIRMYPNRFPEHNGNSWTIGPTTVGDNLVALPSNLLAIDRVHHSQDATITPSDPDTWNTVQERYVAPITKGTIGLLSKSASTGYPTLWDRKSTNLLYFPTTATGYATYFRIYGLAGELKLSAAGDTFRLHRDFDEAVTLLAASKFAEVIGQPERSFELEASTKRKMTGGMSVTGRERMARPMTITVRGMPRGGRR